VRSGNPVPFVLFIFRPRISNCVVLRRCDAILAAVGTALPPAIEAVLSLPCPRPPRCVPDVRDLNNVAAHAIENFVRIADHELTRTSGSSVLYPLYGYSHSSFTASRMLAITFRAPLGERSCRYAKILSQSAKASGVNRTLMGRGVCLLLPQLHQQQTLPDRLAPIPYALRRAPDRS